MTRMSTTNPGSGPSTAWSETLLENEEQIHALAVEAVKALQRKSAGKSDKLFRTFHAKQILGTRAVLRVLPGIPAEARYGPFKESRTYEAFARFSNGSPVRQPDKTPDQRALALKILDAPGPPLLDAAAAKNVQDIVTSNDPIFFLRSSIQFLALSRVLLGNGGLLQAVKTFGLSDAYNLTKFGLRHVLASRSVALERYWTGAALTLGPHAVKLELRPAPGARRPTGHFDSTDYLRDELQTRLAAADVRFDLYAQFHVSSAKTPIEDPTVVWKESDAPPVKLAELIFERHDPASLRARQDDQLVESLSFSPWHGSTDMKPLGEIMRLRRVAYEASAKERHSRIVSLGLS